MRLPSILVVVGLAVLAQVTLARFTVGGTWVFDLVLVGVVYAGLQGGPMAGAVGGTVGGLLQDLLSGQVVGVSGLAKTLVGFVAGVIGTQFVLTRPHGRSIIVAGSTLLHRGLMLALAALIDQEWPAVSGGAMLAETALNTLAGFVLFQAAGALPDAVTRYRVNRRASLGRRRW